MCKYMRAYMRACVRIVLFRRRKKFIISDFLLSYKKFTISSFMKLNQLFDYENCLKGSTVA